MAAERALLFIDGSNFYHHARDIGIATGSLDYRILARKLTLDRQLVGIRYYVGKVSGDFSRIASQGKFLDRIRSHPGARTGVSGLTGAPGACLEIGGQSDKGE